MRVIATAAVHPGGGTHRGLFLNRVTPRPHHPSSRYSDTGIGYGPLMSNHKDEPIELEDVPEEEGISGADAAEQLAQSPEEKPNYTETHPAEARRERERHGDDTPTG